MFYKGVFESFVNGLGKGNGLFFRQVNGRNDFTEDGLIQRFADDRVFHALADIIETSEIGTEDHRRVSAVQDTDLLFLKGLNVIGKFNMEFTRV